MYKYFICFTWISALLRLLPSRFVVFYQLMGKKAKGNKERVHLGKSLIYYGLHTNLLVLLALCCLHLQLIRVKKRF